MEKELHVKLFRYVAVIFSKIEFFFQRHKWYLCECLAAETDFFIVLCNISCIVKCLPAGLI